MPFYCDMSRFDYYINENVVIATCDIVMGAALRMRCERKEDSILCIQ